MTKSKAIEILSRSANEERTTFNQDFNNAEKLGIEALKELTCLRSDDRTQVRSILPGETPSGDSP